MKKKGFTLIELLAVIIVLSVIALITVPVITNLIGMSKKKAFESKIYALVEAAETYYEKVALEEDEEIFKESLEGTPTLSINLSNKEEVKKLNIKTFEKGLLTITDNGEITVTAIEDNLCGEKTPRSKIVNMLDIKKDFSCYLLNGSTSDIETQDILTAMNNLKSSNQELISRVEQLSKDNESLKETVKTISNNGVGTESALNKIYPVGSIYISTTLKNVTEVKESLGGEWEVYGDGKVLRSSTGSSGQTGGSSTVSLTTTNLPSHNHSYTPAGSVTSTFTGTSVNTSNTGSGYSIKYGASTRTSGVNSVGHTHAFSGTTSTNGEHSHTERGANSPYGSSGHGIALNANYYGNSNTNHTVTPAGDHAHTFSGTTGGQSANHTHQYDDYYATGISGVESHRHTVTAQGSVTSSFTGTKTNTENTGSNTAFSVLDPYITVYMYKRIS